MAVYTHVSHEDIASFLQGYDVGELRLALGIAEGVENSNYLLECERDGAVSKYILTLYEKRVDANDLPFFMGLMEYLARAGIDSPLPVHARSGDVVNELSDRPAAIVSFLNGSSRTVLRNAHVDSLGNAMAEMHMAAQSYDVVRVNTLSLDGWKELYVEIGDKLDTISVGLSDIVKDELDYLSECWPSDLPKGVIHADLFPDNVFFDGDNVSGIIDFYFACNDMLAYDLAICLNCWCFEYGAEFNLTKAQKMLKSYNKVRPLTDAEKQALPILARGAALRFLLTRAYDWINHDDGALVTAKDPMEYVKKLQFHQGVKSVMEYGI